MLLFLIGMPGCGKSTLSEFLSGKLNLERIDLDEEIVRLEKRSIETIFRDNGEGYFREIERQVVVKSCKLNNAVISTGGGAPCFHDNMKVMKEAGITVFLNVPVHTLVSRLQSFDAGRPMLNGKSEKELADFLHQKLHERLPFYHQADLVLNGEDIQGDEVIAALSKKGFI